VPVLGLPGNPVSAMVCGALFLLPALALMQGLPGGPPPTGPGNPNVPSQGLPTPPPPHPSGQPVPPMPNPTRR